MIARIKTKIEATDFGGLAVVALVAVIVTAIFVLDSLFTYRAFGK